MALLFMDGFDAGDGSTKWSTMGMGVYAATRFGTGRSSTNIEMLSCNCSGNIGLGGVGRAYLDDLYVCDATGTTNNTFLGDVRVHTLVPSGNGTDSGLTGSDGNQVNNYQLVNTVP